MNRESIREANQLKAVESLADWSKWLIGINFTAATGCTVVLKLGVGAATKLYLLIAILSFAGAVFCSIFLVRVLASLVEHVPLVDEGTPRSINEYEIWRGLTVKRLAHLQVILFTIGILFFFVWVYNVPANA